METAKGKCSLNKDYSINCDFRLQWDTKGPMQNTHAGQKWQGNLAKTTQNLLYSVDVCYWCGMKVNWRGQWLNLYVYGVNVTD